jgi:glutathione S-transferase
VRAYPHVDTWLRRIAERPAVARAERTVRKESLP